MTECLCVISFVVLLFLLLTSCVRLRAVCVSFGIAVNFRFPKGPSNISLSLSHTRAIYTKRQWRHHSSRCNSALTRVLISLSFGSQFLVAALHTARNIVVCVVQQQNSSNSVCSVYLLVCVSLSSSFIRSVDYYY